MGNCCCWVVGPDEALIISGGCFKDRKRQILGGFGCACPCVAEVTILPLNIMTLLPEVLECETQKGNIGSPILESLEKDISLNRKG